MSLKVEAETRKSFDPLALDNQLCFSIYTAANAIKAAYKPLLQELRLTYPQYLVLIVLWQSDKLKVSHIAHRLNLDSGSLTPVLKRLEVAGLLKRTRGVADEREVQIALTPTGAGLHQRALGVRREIVRQLNMTESEIARLRTELIEMVATLGAAGQPSASLRVI